MRNECAEKVDVEIRQMEADLDFSADYFLRGYSDPLEYASAAHWAFNRTQNRIKTICHVYNVMFTELPVYGAKALGIYLEKMQHTLDAYNAKKQEI